MIRNSMDHIASLSRISSPYPPLSLFLLLFTFAISLSNKYFQYYFSAECHGNLLAYLQSLIRLCRGFEVHSELEKSCEQCIQARDQSSGTRYEMFLTVPDCSWLDCALAVHLVR